jgi:hypothetical protein
MYLVTTLCVVTQARALRVLKLGTPGADACVPSVKRGNKKITLGKQKAAVNGSPRLSLGFRTEASRDYLMNSISWYVGSGHRSSAT